MREFSSQDEADEFFIAEALKEAKKAFQKKEVPVGAILVRDSTIIAKAHNQVEMLQDATAHAEMICLTMGSSALGNWRLSDVTLYCTVEPCAMCAGAMMLARIKRLVWAAPDIRVGANGSWVDLFEKKHPIHTIEVKQHVLEQPCKSLMQDFFRKRREETAAMKREEECEE